MSKLLILRIMTKHVEVPLNIVKKNRMKQNNVMEVLPGKWYNHRVWVAVSVSVLQ